MRSSLRHQRTGGSCAGAVGGGSSPLLAPLAGSSPSGRSTCASSAASGSGAVGSASFRSASAMAAPYGRVPPRHIRDDPDPSPDSSGQRGAAVPGVSPMRTRPGRCEHGEVAVAVRRPSHVRFPRSSGDRVLVGVAGGLARRLQADPYVVRLAFVVLTLAGGLGVPLYLVAWALSD